MRVYKSCCIFYTDYSRKLELKLRQDCILSDADEAKPFLKALALSETFKLTPRKLDVLISQFPKTLSLLHGFRCFDLQMDSEDALNDNFDHRLQNLFKNLFVKEEEKTY